MKNLVSLSCLFLLYGCIFTYDPPRALFYVNNYSDEAIYVYFKCGNVDSLPLSPKLELFHFGDAVGTKYENIEEYRFYPPEYRINAYDGSFLFEGTIGTDKKPRLPCKEKEVTLFFITEKTMRSYDWEEIHKNQLFTKKITLTQEELESKNWEYIYP
ncbi:hypothetical protein FACS1894201_11610 [Bacteroidia bacterium]|nr:hypothetical protein FACS1894201_11610 [Bacteroidia bacterium]